MEQDKKIGFCDVPDELQGRSPIEISANLACLDGIHVSFIARQE